MSRREASDSVSMLGWRFLLGSYCACVRVSSLAEAGAVAARALTVPGVEGHLRLDLRADRVLLTVGARNGERVAQHETELVRELSRLGFSLEPQPLQLLEIAIDAMDIAAIRPFWKAALGYGDSRQDASDTDDLTDPLGVGPAVWFQQMDAPRPQRNRIHFDISVPHDEAQARIAAVLAAGGSLVYDAEAPAFWVFADFEGNEVCITTWQGRD